MKKPPRPGQTDQDRDIWHLVTRQIAPFRKQAVKKPDLAPVAVDVPVTAPLPEPAVPKFDPIVFSPPGVSAKTINPGLDRRSQEKLRRGKMPIDARLDLHGMPGVAARLAVMEFLQTGYRRGWRCVLIITGKGGKRDGDGVLRQSLSHWLAEPSLRPIVLSIEGAQPRHGGGGAFYILIRRQRSTPD